MTCLLLPNAVANIRLHLQAVEAKLQATTKSTFMRIQIAMLTQGQFDWLNVERAKTNRPVLTTLVVEYDGRHHYQSRIKDGYGIDDMVSQIESALDSTSIVVVEHYHPQFVNLVNSAPRNDGYGNQVLDTAAFNVSTRQPTTELFSVIPHGDVKKPKK